MLGLRVLMGMQQGRSLLSPGIIVSMQWDARVLLLETLRLLSAFFFFFFLKEGFSPCTK